MQSRARKDRRLQGAGATNNARVSKGMGAADPRTHRNQQATIAPEMQLANPLQIDGKQRLSIRAGRGVPDVPSTGTLADLIASHNALLASLRERGIIER